MICERTSHTHEVFIKFSSKDTQPLLYSPVLYALPGVAAPQSAGESASQPVFTERPAADDRDGGSPCSCAVDAMTTDSMAACSLTSADTASGFMVVAVVQSCFVSVLDVRFDLGRARSAFGCGLCSHASTKTLDFIRDSIGSLDLFCRLV